MSPGGGDQYQCLVNLPAKMLWSPSEVTCVFVNKFVKREQFSGPKFYKGQVQIFRNKNQLLSVNNKSSCSKQNRYIRCLYIIIFCIFDRSMCSKSTFSTLVDCATYFLQ